MRSAELFGKHRINVAPTAQKIPDKAAHKSPIFNGRL